MAGPGAKDYIIIDGFLIDCSLSENHTFDSDVTDYPVESGANIADNIRPLPIQVDIEGIVTNTPIGLMREKRATPDATNRTFLLQFARDVFNIDSKPTDDAYALFERIRDAREPVTISTSLRTFDNMVMQSLSIPRGDHMDHLRFQAKFKQIIMVENKRTIRVSTPIGGGKTGVRKPSDPYGGRTILIDRFLGKWWDPDVLAWRHLAKFEQTVTENVGSSTVVAKWHLYRVRTKIRTSGYDSTQVPAIGAVSLDADRSILTLAPDPRSTTTTPWDQIINVPVNKCVLHDFIIQRVPGAEPDQVRVLKNRNP